MHCNVMGQCQVCKYSIKKVKDLGLYGIFHEVYVTLIMPGQAIENKII